MPVQPTYPGVYVQEEPSGVRTIVGVSTSTAIFIGRTKQGPLDEPIQCFNYSDFERRFSSDTSVGDMARYVKLFFLNGGSQCYVMRIANGATAAEVTLKSEEDIGVLTLTAKQEGVIGETIRAAVTYRGQQPEATFNLELFRWETNPAGQREQVDREEWKNLSMNPTSNLYAPTFLTQNSNLVDAALAGTAPPSENGFSQSGRPVAYVSGTPTTLRTAWEGLIGDEPAATANNFQISVDGSEYIDVDLSGIDVSDINATIFASPSDVEPNGFPGTIKEIIENTFSLNGLPGTTISVSLQTGPNPIDDTTNDTTSLLRISSENQGDIYIRPVTTDDAAVPLMLGTAQGGLEISAHAYRRPAPTGITLRTSDPNINPNIDPYILSQLAGLEQSEVTQITLPAVQTDGTPITVDIPIDLVTTDPNDPWYRDSNTSTGNNSGLREKLGIIRNAINEYHEANSRTFFLKAELWGARLAIMPTSGEDNETGSLSTGPTDVPTSITTTSISNCFTMNIRYYSVGVGGTTGLQTPAAALASDGNSPQLSDYDDAYKVVDKEVDLFNLLILPPDANPTSPMSDIYRPASVFCQERRAFLLMDAPADWTNVNEAINGVDALRIGLVTDHSALFYPRLTINEDDLRINIGPSGAVAGLIARIDANRGVWKAPAGTEAELRGVVGVKQRFSDAENGALNPRAINTIRIFPNGIVNWGARTMDGDDDFASEWKYIPVRRTALFIEESLYRGLKWVVFEPNDESLWAQIRLNVGAFMHNLFRQGAFQGTKKDDAYFVKCDSETTTQNDINMGIVNIWVGFAPLKPAEFVILHLQQMAGQIEV